MDFSDLKEMTYPIFNDDILHIIDDYNLWKIFNYIVENNNSNFLPYHNIRHILHVTKAAHDIYWKRLHNECDLCDCDDCAWENFYSTSEELVTASLFHDFNHSGGKLKDKENVDIAINKMREFFLMHTSSSDARIKRIEDIIRATEYPYSEKNNINILSEIIRDADLSQSASDDFLFYVIGLMQETNTSLNDEDIIYSFKEIVFNTIAFNKNNKFFLEESEELFGEKRRKNIQMLENILKYGY